MDRYRTNFNKDDASTAVGDVTFLGVDQFSAPENIQPGNVQDAVNVDFDTTNAQTRGGFVCLPELGVQSYPINWDTATSWTTSNSNLTSIAFGKNTFVAVGTSSDGSGNFFGNSYVSDDCQNWTRYAFGGTYSNISKVAFANGRFVASGTRQIGGTAIWFYSDDGTTWTESVSTATFPPVGTAYGNGIWVSVCGLVSGDFYPAVSTNNGVTWTSYSNTVNDQIAQLIYSNGKFIAATVSGFITTSVDGVTWTAKLKVANFFSPYGFFEFGNGNYIISGGSSVYYSSDCVTWNTAQAPSGYQYRCATFANGRFVGLAWDSTTGVVISLTSIYGTSWIKQATSYVSGFSLYPIQMANDGNCVVAISSSISGSNPFIYSHNAITTIFASGLYSDPNAIGQVWLMMVAGDSVGFYQFGEDSRSVSLGSYHVEEQSTIVQCNNLVYLFRGADQQPLYWDGNWSNSFQLVPLTTPAAGFETIPYSSQATYYQNRLWVINGKDTISASDVLDFNTYDQLANEFNISTGNSDYLVATFPFGQTTLLAFKHKSILALQQVDGALTDVFVTEITRQVGLVGINAIVSIGPDLAYVSDKNINLITLTNTNNAVQHKTLPLSSKIRRIMDRVNWEYGYKISLGYLNNKLYVSLPLDNSPFCNAVVVYNFITENWYGEWNFDFSINMCIQGWQVANYLGLQRMHAVTEDGRIFVTDEGQNDISGTTVAEIALSLTTRPYNASNLNHFQRRLFVDIATNRPSFSITSYTEGVSEESVLLTDQTYSRAESWKFSDSTYDLTNANDDYNRAYRKDYSTGPASVQCGSGFLPEVTQQIRLPLISQRNGRLSWLNITNDQGFLELLSAGFEVRPGLRGSLVQV